MGYAKLFASICESSLWCEPKDARLLFVTMLARADSTGFVEAALPGLARVANLTRDETVAALAVLMAPDSDSKDLAENPGNEGRRVVKVPGGWAVLNYESYRNRQDENQRREYMREYMRAYRRKQAVNAKANSKTPVNAGKGRLAQAETETETETEAKKKRSSPKAATDAGFERFWAAYPRKVGRGAAEKAWRGLRPGLYETILAAVETQAQPNAQLDTSTRTDPDGRSCVPHPATWLNGKRWDDAVDRPQTLTEQLARRASGKP